MSKPTKKPAPTFDYQGAGLSLLSVDVNIGPFTFTANPDLTFGHAVAFEQVGNIRQIQLRPAKAKTERDPPTNQFVMGYQQAGVEWEMIFRITSDPGGGLIGAAFGLEVESNYPQTEMTIERLTINQKAFGALVQATLPADYRAQMTTRFWSNGKHDYALDGWIMLEIGYLPDDARGKTYRPEDVPMIVLGEVVLFPAEQESKAGVIGNNYPKQVRKR